MTILADPFEVTIADPNHFEAEMRFVSVGQSETGRVLVVSYTERDQRTRIISARKAARKERSQYESRNQSS